MVFDDVAVIDIFLIVGCKCLGKVYVIVDVTIRSGLIDARFVVVISCV